ncbi:hypothetical protein VPHK567_0023 [Vibrio phage K567]
MKLRSKRDKKIEALAKGLHKFTLHGIEYNATLDVKYLPRLDRNKAEMRKNYTDTTQITFFDCNTNNWITVEYDEATK